MTRVSSIPDVKELQVQPCVNILSRAAQLQAHMRCRNTELPSPSHHPVPPRDVQSTRGVTVALRHGPGPPGDERPCGAGGAGESHPPGQVSGHWRWGAPAGAGGGMGATGSSHGVPAWLSACTKQADKGHRSPMLCMHRSIENTLKSHQKVKEKLLHNKFLSGSLGKIKTDSFGFNRCC